MGSDGTEWSCTWRKFNYSRELIDTLHMCKRFIIVSVHMGHYGQSAKTGRFRRHDSETALSCAPSSHLESWVDEVQYSGHRAKCCRLLQLVTRIETCIRVFFLFFFTSFDI